MTPQQFKTAGIICLVICAICLFIAWERNQANSDVVSVLKQFGGENLLGGALQPAMPAASKYALFFAVLSGIGGVCCLIKAKRPT